MLEKMSLYRCTSAGPNAGTSSSTGNHTETIMSHVSSSVLYLPKHSLVYGSPMALSKECDVTTGTPMVCASALLHGNHQACAVDNGYTAFMHGNLSIRKHILTQPCFQPSSLELYQPFGSAEGKKKRNIRNTNRVCQLDSIPTEHGELTDVRRRTLPAAKRTNSVPVRNVTSWSAHLGGRKLYTPCLVWWCQDGEVKRKGEVDGTARAVNAEFSPQPSSR